MYYNLLGNSHQMMRFVLLGSDENDHFYKNVVYFLVGFLEHMVQIFSSVM
jgi:hypothetical protein